MYNPKEDKPDFTDGYDTDVGGTIRFPPMAYYNLIVYDLSPKKLYDVFTCDDRRELERVEDVEMALMYINDALDADNFNAPFSDKWNNQELLMKGYVLERIRFNILREQWEPVFSPFPHNPLQWYDPDVTVVTSEEREHMWVKVREHPHTNYLTLHIVNSSRNDNYFIEEGENKFESDYIAEVCDDYHTFVEESDEYSEAYANEIGEKFAKLLEEYRRKTNDKEQQQHINGFMSDS